MCGQSAGCALLRRCRLGKFVKPAPAPRLWAPSVPAMQRAALACCSCPPAALVQPDASRCPSNLCNYAQTHIDSIDLQLKKELNLGGSRNRVWSNKELKAAAAAACGKKPTIRPAIRPPLWCGGARPALQGAAATAGKLKEPGWAPGCLAGRQSGRPQRRCPRER